LQSIVGKRFDKTIADSARRDAERFDGFGVLMCSTMSESVART
jgi:hypothetical protein